MACTSKAHTTASMASGAFEIDKNPATIGGYACVAGGSALALGVGAAVAPVPVLGLTAAGAGLIVLGNIEDVKSALSGNKSDNKSDNTDAAVAAATA